MSLGCIHDHMESRVMINNEDPRTVLELLRHYTDNVNRLLAMYVIHHLLPLEFKQFGLRKRIHASDEFNLEIN